MLKDERGLAFTASSKEAVAAFDKTIDAYFRMGRDIGPNLKATLEIDPEMPMAHCLKGYFFHLMAAGPMLERAYKSYETALILSDTASPREKAHIAALGKWCQDDKAAATRIWDEVLDEHPTDVIALRLTHHAHFYTGNAAVMRQSLETAFKSWDSAMPGYSHVLGMRAFAFEECGDYGLAEEQGRKAIGLNPLDPWAVHAVAHIMEMQDRNVDGIGWITDLEQHWMQANNFRYHLIWHRALMYLGQGAFEQVLKIYDEHLWDPQSDEYLDICNDASLLIRLEFLGVDVGDRWQALQEKVQNRTHEHIMTFVDAHFELVLASAGDTQGAGDLIDSFNEKGGTERLEIGVPLCQAIADYRSGAYKQAQTTLMDLRGRIIEIGGSHAQRDVFELLLIEASIRCGDIKTARHMLENRTQANPENGLNWKKLAEILPDVDDHAAKEAGAHAARLLVA